MIEVAVTKQSVTVKGHAGYAENGKDIVCAAVSALTCTLIRAIDALTKDEIICAIHDGYTHVGFENLSEGGKLLVDSFFIGICGLIEEYPQYVKLAP